MTDDAQRKKGTRKVLFWAALATILLFGFGYALVPVYNVMCKVFGINGKTENSSISNNNVIDTSRTITVTFIATNNEKLPWAFKPLVKKLEVHPGQNVKLAYYAKNDSDKTMTVQAIPSVTPGIAANYLKKTECFCFNQQTLKAHQAMKMPLIFHLDTNLPKNIKDVTLSYTLFKSLKPVKNKAKGKIG